MFYFILLIKIVLLNPKQVSKIYAYKCLKLPKNKVTSEKIGNTDDCESILLNT